MTPTAARDEVGALWLHMLQRAVGLASHDVKDALNGVSVNLEVIRSRSEHPDTPASAVTQFSISAASQLERLTTLIEAVLALGRGEREPADVAVILRRIVTLCGAGSALGGGVVLRDHATLWSTTTRVSGEAVRLALMAPVLRIVTAATRTASRAVTCALGGDAGAVIVTISAGASPVAMPDDIADVVRAAGVRWTDETNEMTLAFPRA